MNKKNDSKMAKIKICALSAIAAIMLVGCTTASVREKEDLDVSNKVVAKTYNKQINDMKDNNSAVFAKDNGSWFENRPIDGSKDGRSAVELTSDFDKKITFVNGTTSSVADLSARVGQLTNMIITVDKSVIENSGEGSSAAGGAGGGQDSTSLGGKPGAAGASDSGVGSVGRLTYKGSVKGLLDTIAGKAQIYWKWDGQQVMFYATETKVFKINALPGTVAGSSTVATAAASNGGASSGGGTSSASTSSTSNSQSLSISSTYDVWKEIKEQLAAVMSPNGKLSVVQSTGFVTVTDNPKNLLMIEKQIKEINKTLGKQVMVNVEVYSVEFTNKDDYGTNFNLLFNKLGNKFNIGLTPGATLTNNLLTATFSDPTNVMDGSSAIISALSSLGTTNLVTNASLLTLNGQTVPLQVTKEVAYLQSVQVTAGQNGAQPQAQLTPGTTTEGFVINLTPRITDTKTVFMQYNIDLSQIDQIVPFSSGGNQIQLPTRTVRNFIQRVGLTSGETLMLAGFKQVSNTGSSSGIGSAKNWFFPGGSKESNLGEKVIVRIVKKNKDLSAKK